jgi:hypothetical protein
MQQVVKELESWSAVKALTPALARRTGRGGGLILLRSVPDHPPPTTTPQGG